MVEKIPGSADFTGRENPIDLRYITHLISEWQHSYNNLRSDLQQSQHRP